MICKECGAECADYKVLGTHISKIHYISTEEYYRKHLLTDNSDKCKECGKQLSKQAVEEYDPFVKDTHFCSNECRRKFNRRIYEERGWIHKCENCGKEFIRDGGWFCSRECCIEAKRNGWKKPEPVEEKVEWFNT